MDSVQLFEGGAQTVLFFGASTMRLVVAFLMLPLFTGELIPPLVRNSLFLALSVVVFVLQPDLARELSSVDWAGIYIKEAFIGLSIGVFFGVFLWAFESAGVVIDSQIGSSMAMVFDPLSGHEVTLFGEFIGRWINYIFLAAGGLLFLTLAVIESYIAWPLLQALPQIRLATLTLFEQEFSRYLYLMLMIAAPVMVVLFIIDMAMGLINRFAQRLNVLFLSMSIKGLAALIVMMLLLPVLMQLLLREVNDHQDAVLRALGSLLAG